MKNKNEIKRLFNLLKPYARTIIFIIICLFISAGINMLIPLLSRDIMDNGFIAKNYDVLVKLVSITIMFYVLNTIIDIVKEKKRIEIVSKIQYKLTEQSFKHLMKIKICYFNNRNYGEILNNLSMDINKITSIADDNTFFALAQIFRSKNTEDIYEIYKSILRYYSE